VSKAVSQAVIDRIRKVARADPSLTKVDLAQRFGVSFGAIVRALQNNAAQSSGLRFPAGTSVKFTTDGKVRTGVVIEDALSFPWRDHRKVAIDPRPGGYIQEVTEVLVPAAELKEIKPSERPESARPREQVPLFDLSRGDE